MNILLSNVKKEKTSKRNLKKSQKTIDKTADL